MSRILIVDDEPSISWGLSRLVRGMGHEADVASSAEQGLDLATRSRPDVLILDVRLPGIDGLTAMDAFGRQIGAMPVIVITAFGDLATAVEAINKGAFEYIVKPFDTAEIRAVIERALRIAPAAAAATPLVDTVDGMLGRTSVMQRVFKKIALAANSEAAVLVVGEHGVGKELAATAIHRHSARRHGPMVTLNAGSLAEPTAEVELFGQAAGTADGAHARPGLLLQAHGGTLFIDEIADLPLSLQQKLLRVLDHGEVLPIGSETPLRSRFRVIAATECDLRRKVEEGAFRHDLYLRLGTFEIELPPLRDRRDDIPLLAQSFASQVGDQQAMLADETIAELQARPWFGNVRELRSAIEHALVLARRGVVMPEHLPAALPNLWQPRGSQALPQAVADAVSQIARQLLADPATAGDLYDRFLQQVEPPLLATVMERCGQRCAPAARILGLHRTTLKKKLTQYEIEELAGNE